MLRSGRIAIVFAGGERVIYRRVDDAPEAPIWLRPPMTPVRRYALALGVPHQ
jgi:hypothetical protein